MPKRSMSIRTLSIKQAEIEADDLLIEIMLRLPSYSIDRFISLCKQWHSLITSSKFRKLWRRRNFKPAAGLILVSGYNYTYSPICFIPFSSNISKTISSLVPIGFTVEQFCNGLLLGSTGSGSWYHVYNPTTKMSVTLPNLDCDTGNVWSRKMSLAYDPVKSPHYKVISSTVLYRTRNDVVNQIHIYSRSTRRWTFVLERRPQGYYLNKGIYWNGSINWIYPMLYFNIEDQTLKAMPVPPDPTSRMINYLGESCGRLNYVVIGRSTPCFIDVYELKRDYSQWFLKYHVSIENCSTVLSVVHGLEEDDSFLVLRIKEKIVRYNLVSKTSEGLQVLLPPWNESILPYQYVESLCGV